MINHLEVAFKNIYCEKVRQGVMSKTVAPISRTMRELKEKKIVAVAPIFYILNRYATLGSKLRKTMKNGNVNAERYEAE